MEKRVSNARRIDLIPQRLRDARILSELSIKEVAETMNITAQVLSMYELGRCSPSLEVFFKLKNMYGFPTRFYTKPYSKNVTRSQVYFRSFSTATKTKRELALKQAELVTSEVIPVLVDKVRFPSVDSLFVKIKQSHRVEKIRDMDYWAKVIRKAWKLDMNPIRNLTRELEKRGVIVITMEFDDKIDGFSFWEGDRPFIFVNKNTTAVRLRMSIAHELCHLFFHEAEDIREKFKVLEAEAKYFASAFLLPDIAFSDDVCSTSFNANALFLLKAKWLTSLAAMVVRCEHLGLVTEERILYLQKQISRKHWRKIEPDDDEYVCEKPVLLKQAIEFLVDRALLCKEQILEEIPLDTVFISKVCMLPNDYFSRDDTLIKSLYS